ncbi:DUF2147 domain-containing protein [uncultured Caulobacter sp.]|uniref:DUF2147 domain-containing protein n=1 Tax=uncultured Caulobacter sp. TaxID=158749 RepID=UPI00260F8996|nr:DUF2147 domain-containing protein [uncultured Caulobacter sp.]
MRFVKLALTACGAALAVAAATTPAQAAGGGDIARSYGVWRNPHNTVHLEIKDCGPSTCGVVVWASPKAEADARKSGTDTLIGKQLLRDFETQRDGSMKGRVWVPTLKVTLVGSADIVDSRTMRARGCVIGNFLCKSQLWTRIDSPSMLADRTAP